MVSLILLAAFSLNSPGWLLLMENNVMTPKKKTGMDHWISVDETDWDFCHLPDVFGYKS